MTIKNLKPRCSIGEDNLLVCKPEWEEDGRRVVPDAPAKFKLEGDRATIVDSGGLNTEVLDKIQKHIEENVL